MAFPFISSFSTTHSSPKYLKCKIYGISHSILQKNHTRSTLKQGQAFVLVASCSHSQALHVAPGHAWNQEGLRCNLDE